METCVLGMVVVNLHGSVLIHPRKERKGKGRRGEERRGGGGGGGEGEGEGKRRKKNRTEQTTGSMGSHPSPSQHISVPRSPERQGSSSWFASRVPDSLTLSSYGLQAISSIPPGPGDPALLQPLPGTYLLWCFPCP